VPNLLVVNRKGEENRVSCDVGVTLMEVLRGRGYEEIIALCGGSCSCGTCHVYVDEVFLDKLPAMSNAETDLLDASFHRRPGSRLACQIPFTQHLDGIRITMPPED